MGFERKSFSKNPIIFNPMRKQKVTLKVWFLFLPRRVTVWEEGNYEVIDPDGPGKMRIELDRIWQICNRY